MPVRLRIAHTTAVRIGDRLEPLGTAVVVAAAVLAVIVLAAALGTATLLSLLDLFWSHR